jgi:hypothetical protein
MHVLDCLFAVLQARYNRTHRIVMSFQLSHFIAKGDKMTIENLIVGQTVPVTSLTPVDAGLKPTSAIVNSATYTSSDPTIATVAPDPANPLGAIVTAVAAGSAQLTVSAQITEPDGTKSTVPGSATIVVAGKPDPTVAVVINFGTPVTPPPPPPPPPPAV